MLPLIDEIQLFARDFINYKAFRTAKRKSKVRIAYRFLTGKEIKTSCHTCYIEALLEIINSKPMSTPNYQLKKGVLLQAFGDASKTCTNDTLTDELAQWYLSHYPEKIIYFERVPQPPITTPSSTIKIIHPTEKKEEVFEPANMIKETLGNIAEEKEPKRGRKAGKR